MRLPTSINHLIQQFETIVIEQRRLSTRQEQLLSQVQEVTRDSTDNQDIDTISDQGPTNQAYSDQLSIPSLLPNHLPRGMSYRSEQEQEGSDGNSLQPDIVVRGNSLSNEEEEELEIERSGGIICQAIEAADLRSAVPTIEDYPSQIRFPTAVNPRETMSCETGSVRFRK